MAHCKGDGCGVHPSLSATHLAKGLRESPLLWLVCSWQSTQAQVGASFTADSICCFCDFNNGEPGTCSALASLYSLSNLCQAAHLAPCNSPDCAFATALICSASLNTVLPRRIPPSSILARLSLTGRRPFTHFLFSNLFGLACFCPDF